MDYLLRSSPSQIQSDVSRMIAQRGISNEQLSSMKGNLQAMIGMLNL